MNITSLARTAVVVHWVMIATSATLLVGMYQAGMSVERVVGSAGILLMLTGWLYTHRAEMGGALLTAPVSQFIASVALSVTTGVAVVSFPFSPYTFVDHFGWAALVLSAGIIAWSVTTRFLR